MSEDVMNSTVEYVQKKLEERNYDYVNLTFFGGEPLLFAEKNVLPLLERIKGICDKHTKPFYPFFITNGALLTEELVLKLKPYSPTLDGNKEKHNKVRIGKENDYPTFDKIISAFKAISKHISYEDVKLVTYCITLRINYDNQIHHSWGNGSAGIGLSRKLISECYYSNEFMQSEIKISIENIDKSIHNAFQNDHSICSGLLGLLEIRKILDSKFDYMPLLDRYCTEFKEVESVRCGGWAGNPLITGLFYGIAGINYNLIKLLHPNLKIPSLLWI
jgi:hypothetical protein